MGEGLFYAFCPRSHSVGQKWLTVQCTVYSGPQWTLRSAKAVVLPFFGLAGAPGSLARTFGDFKGQGSERGRSAGATTELYYGVSFIDFM